MEIETVDLTGSLPPTPVKPLKRALDNAACEDTLIDARPSHSIDLIPDEDDEIDMPPPKRTKLKAQKEKPVKQETSRKTSPQEKLSKRKSSKEKSSEEKSSKEKSSEEKSSKEKSSKEKSSKEKSSKEKSSKEKSSKEKSSKEKSSKEKSSKEKSFNEPASEKRLKRYRPTPPTTIHAVYDRALNQRMFCLDRQRAQTAEHPTETLKIAGSTGNVYTVKIDKIPSCDCPHAAKGNECKHVLFALVRVFKAADYWQKAYLSSELQTIFDNAPPIVPVDAEKTDNNRKPIHDDDTCPICFMEFENGHEGTVFCRAACGNNIHKECFDQWAASRKRSAAPVTCPFCRSRWATGDGPGGTVSMDIVSQRSATGEGYVNVAEELGISTQRDYNSYHSFWVRRQARGGLDVGDWDDPNPDWSGRYG